MPCDTDCVVIVHKGNRVIGFVLHERILQYPPQVVSRTQDRGIVEVIMQRHIEQLHPQGTHGLDLVSRCVTPMR